MSKKKSTRTTPPAVVLQQASSHTQPLIPNNSPLASRPPNYGFYGVCLALFAVILAIYWVGIGNDYVDWDDYEYVKENAYILHPTWHSAVLFLKSAYFGNYHPLTMWSYMANVALFGTSPSSFIVVNIVLHAVNTCLVCYFAYRLSSRSLWVGAFTALFFAIHPLHVESVVWVSERKDVLYTFFFLLAGIAYLSYIGTKQRRYYGLTLGLFVLSCLSKPAAIVCPIVLLLLDDWHNRPLLQVRVWVEKLPFFALSLLFGSIALSIQAGGDFYGMLPTLSTKAFAVSDLDLTFLHRCQDASYGFMTYLLRLFVPYGMAAYHPYPTVYSSPLFIIYPIVAVLLIAATIYSRRYTKILFFGIGFYLVNLLLVLQFVSVGSAIIAERYTYIAHIGILFALFYGLQQWLVARPHLRNAFSGTALLIALIFAIIAHNYIPAWKNTVALWDNVILYYPDIAKPYTLRGTFKGKSGDLAAAVQDFEHALSLDTTYAGTYEGLGNVYGMQGQPQKALAMFEKALRYDPHNGKSYYNRALANIQLQQFMPALPDLDRAIELSPNRAADIQSLRGFAYLQLKQYPAAIAAYTAALQLQANANAYCYRGIAYFSSNDTDRARADLQKALQLNPKMPEAQQYLDKLAAGGR